MKQLLLHGNAGKGDRGEGVLGGGGG